jgi:hypothetical protein
MRRAHASAAATIAVLLIRGVAAEPSDVVVGSDQRRTYDCAGGSATVEGGFNEVRFKNCVTVLVKGGENTVDAGLADAIAIEGADNKVTWARRADGTRPRIRNEGTENVIVSRPALPGEVRPAAPRASAAPAGRIRIDGDGGKEDHDCRGGAAAINGDGNEVTLRNCEQVDVNGSRNRVTARSAAAIVVNGGDNTVRWEPAADGRNPRIRDNGRGNTITGKR